MKCSMCKSTMPRGTGKMLVRNDGRIFYFCSSKCQKNWGMGRLEKGVKWAQSEKLEKKPPEKAAAKESKK